MQARLFVQQYLLTNDDYSYDMAVQSLAMAVQFLQTLDESISDDMLKSLVGDIRVNIDHYTASFETVSGLIRERNNLIMNGIGVSGPQIAETLSEITEHTGALQDLTGPVVENDLIQARLVAIAIAVAAVMAGIVVALSLIHFVAIPLIRLTSVTERLAQNDLTAIAQGRKRGDEIGAMARAIDVFRENALSVQRLQDEQVQAEETAKLEKRKTMDELAHRFENSVGHLVSDFSRSVEAVKGEAKQMSEKMRTANSRSTEVASTSEQSNSGIQAVSVATEQLSASTQEISSQVSRAASMAQEASREVQSGGDRIEALSESIQKIGEVVNLIQDIAEQTNLLALNATIEAARAGDAGKGFAVVASEVKSLASQSAQATDDIRQQIAAVQEAGSSSVTAIKRISEIIVNLESMNGAVASAVEQQAATTQEIATNIQEVAIGSNEVSSAIATVADSAKDSYDGAASVLSQCEGLENGSTSLSNQVREFLKDVRAA